MGTLICPCCDTDILDAIDAARLVDRVIRCFSCLALLVVRETIEDGKYYYHADVHQEVRHA